MCLYVLLSISGHSSECHQQQDVVCRAAQHAAVRWTCGKRPKRRIETVWWECIDLIDNMPGKWSGIAPSRKLIAITAGQILARCAIEAAGGEGWVEAKVKSKYRINRQTFDVTLNTNPAEPDFLQIASQETQASTRLITPHAWTTEIFRYPKGIRDVVSSCILHTNLPIGFPHGLVCNTPSFRNKTWITFGLRYMSTPK